MVRLSVASGIVPSRARSTRAVTASSAESRSSRNVRSAGTTSNTRSTTRDSTCASGSTSTSVFEISLSSRRQPPLAAIAAGAAFRSGPENLRLAAVLARALGVWSRAGGALGTAAGDADAPRLSGGRASAAALGRSFDGPPAPRRLSAARSTPSPAAARGRRSAVGRGQRSVRSVNATAPHWKSSPAFIGSSPLSRTPFSCVP